MKRILMMVAVAIMTAMTANAQRIQVVDSDGQAIPFVTILNEEGMMIATTNIEGMSDDLQGTKKVVVTHVAFKSKSVNIESDGQRVTLEDADFHLPEITVTKKDYTYLQVYYRVMALNKDGVVFYRAGLVDNFYNEKKGKQESSKQHVTKAKNGTIKIGANLVVSLIVDELATFRLKPMEDVWKKKYKSQGLKIVGEGGRKNIIDNYGTLGSITDKDGQRCMSMDMYLAYLHHLEANGKTKELEKFKKYEAKVENAVRSSYCIYSIDDNGSYRLEDFLMEQHLYSGDYEKQGHCVFVMDFFATDRGYYSKEGMKQVKKDSKVKMTYDWAQQFERKHNIPALAPEIVAKVKGLAEE